MALDKPARRVLSDEALMLLAERPPRTAREMPTSRLFDARRLSADMLEGLMAAVARGLELQPGALRLPPDDSLAPFLQPLATLLSAWVSQQSRDLSIDATLIATRADIETFLRGVPDNRLEEGWRAELVGTSVGRIVAGRAAVAYDGVSRLVLVDVDET